MNLERRDLLKYYDQYITVTGTYSTKGKTVGIKGSNGKLVHYCIENIKLEGSDEIITSHIWCAMYLNQFKFFKPQEGDTIILRGLVKQYTHYKDGIPNRNTNYEEIGLRDTRIKKIIRKKGFYNENN